MTFWWDEVPKEWCVEARRRSEVTRREVYVFPEPVKPLYDYQRRCNRVNTGFDQLLEILPAWKKKKAPKLT